MKKEMLNKELWIKSEGKYIYEESRKISIPVDELLDLVGYTEEQKGLLKWTIL